MNSGGSPSSQTLYPCCFFALHYKIRMYTLHFSCPHYEFRWLTIIPNFVPLLLFLPCTTKSGCTPCIFLALTMNSGGSPSSQTLYPCCCFLPCTTKSGCTPCIFLALTMNSGGSPSSQTLYPCCCFCPALQNQDVHLAFFLPSL